MNALLPAALLLAGTALVGLSLAQTTPPAMPGMTHSLPPGSARESVAPDFTPTYYGHVRPILEANCAGCHTAGGIAPFTLRDPAMARRMAARIAVVTKAGNMPPWMPGGDTPPLLHERKLSAKDIGVLGAWAAAGAPLGDEAQAAPLPKPAGPTVRADMTVGLNEAYRPDEKLSDDYRCFLLDPKLASDRFFTGYRVVPGDPSVVHHVLLFQVLAESRAVALQKAGKDGRQGWQCFGGPNLGDGLGGLTGVLGSWTPGSVPTAFPAGTGIKARAGSLIVMQVHYNLAAGARPDRTKVELQLAPEDAKLDPLGLKVMAAPVEIPCVGPQDSPECSRREALRRSVRDAGQGALTTSQGLLLSCGRTAEEYAKQDGRAVVSTCESKMRRDAQAVSAILHMHTRGKSAKIELNPGTPNAKVLLDIPHWDFHWQGNYDYATPIALKEGDTLRITCVWDNSLAEKQRYVVWGEGTGDEMCLGALSIR